MLDIQERVIERSQKDTNCWDSLRSLVTFRELFWVWTWRNIKVRYKQSILGGLWAILQPLSLMVMFSVIFTYFITIPSDNIPYPLFSYSALLPWTFFSMSISLGANSLINNLNLVTKIYFPKEILPLSAVAANLLDFFIAAAVFAMMVVFYRVNIHITILLTVVLIIIQVLLASGIVLIASATNVFFRDIQFVIPLLMQLWMYATPVIYPISVIPGPLRLIYLLNPMVGIIDAYRRIILLGSWPDWISLGWASASSVLIFIIGYTFFKRVEWKFADLI